MKDDGQTSRVIQGRLDNLPPASAQMVRVFASSTFTDTYVERNTLMKNVYPKLKDYCKTKFGLEFQVVDMRWGVRDEATDDHLTSALCLEEIRNCQRLSLGPNFVTFLGQRYGSRPFPAQISEPEMAALASGLEAVADEDAAALLRTWYARDDNALPPVYVLQPISSMIPEFNAKSESERKEARSVWSGTAVRLRLALTKASKEAVSRGMLTKEEQEKYLMSVTEEEIVHGLLQHKSTANAHCLCIVRLIEDMGRHLGHGLAWRFIDQTPGAEVDGDAQERLANLRDYKVLGSLNRLNVARYSVQWAEDGGINTQDHAAYLDEMSTKFYESMVFLVDKGVTAELALQSDTLCMEALQHLRLAQERIALFHGREELLAGVRGRLQGGGGDGGSLLVIHGSSGCGKTSVMATTAQRWLPRGEQAVVVLRFLGTTPSSAQIHSTLSSVAHQVARAYGGEYTPRSEMRAITEQFAGVLASATAASPLVLLLDSLDQLSAANHAHRLGWLPRRLPAHCHVIVSTLPEHGGGILDALQSRVSESSMIEVPVLGDTLSAEILRSWLAGERRTLTAGQLEVAHAAFRQCSLPIYVKLVFEQVVAWRSYDPPERAALSATVRRVITDLLQRVEKKHGGQLVRRTLGYVTVSRGGLSEGELEDLLSLDDYVLTDVFQYHVPPTRRIPPSLWVRIRHDIRSYLATREADNTTVVYWYHRQFIEAATERYVQGNEQLLCSRLADFYRGRWHGAEKPFRYTAAQMKRLNLERPESAADRYVAAQPLVYSDGEGGRYNLRKLNHLPYYLARAGDMGALKTECLFSYRWLHTKLRAVSVQAILDDVTAADADDDRECSLLQSALNLSRSTLGSHPDTLPVELIGRLKPYRKDYSNISRLVEQCYAEGSTHNVLLPRQQCYNTSAGSLKFPLEHQDHPPSQKMLALDPGGRSLFVGTVQNSLLKWDLEQGEVEKEVRLWTADTGGAGLKLNVIGGNHAGTKLVVGAAFQKEANPLVIVDVQQAEVDGVTHLSKVYTNVGFIDDVRLFVLDNNTLLYVVQGKAVDCFRLCDGSLAHSFDFLPGESSISLEHCTGLVAVKGSSQLHLCDFRNYSILRTIELTGVPRELCVEQEAGWGYAVLAKGDGFVAIDLKTGHSKDVCNTKAAAGDTANSNRNRNVAVSPAGTYVIVKHTSHVCLWWARKLRLAHTFAIPSHMLPDTYKVPDYRAAVTPDESKLVVAYDQYIVVWDIPTRSLLTSTDTLRKIDTLMLTGDSLRAVTSFVRNRLVSVWELERQDEEGHRPIALQSGCRYMNVAEGSAGTGGSGTMVVRGYTSTECRVVALRDGRITGRPALRVETMAPMVSADGSVFLMRDPGKPGGADEQTTSMVACSSKDGRTLGLLTVDGLCLKTFAISNDGAFVVTHEEATPTDDVRITRWLTDGGVSAGTLPARRGGIGHMFITAGDSVLVAQNQYPITENGRRGHVTVYDLHACAEMYTVENVLKDTLQVTPDGKNLVYVRTGSAESDDRLVVQSVRDGRVERELRHLPVGRLHFSEDAARAVDADIRALDLHTDAVLADFADPSERLITKHSNTWPRITPDGRHVVFLVMRKAVVQVGRVDTGQIVGRCFIHAMPLSLQLGAGVVAVGADDGRIVLLEIIDRATDEEGADRRLSELAAFEPRPSALMRDSRSLGKPAGMQTTQSACCCII